MAMAARRRLRRCQCEVEEVLAYTAVLTVEACSEQAADEMDELGGKREMYAFPHFIEECPVKTE